jgi:hypothetical protein
MEHLNAALLEGWRVVSATPMGGGGDTSDLAALVILEKDVTPDEVARLQAAIPQYIKEAARR